MRPEGPCHAASAPLRGGALTRLPPQLKDQKSPQGFAQIGPAGDVLVHKGAHGGRVKDALGLEAVRAEQIFHEGTHAPAQPLRHGNLKAPLVAVQDFPDPSFALTVIDTVPATPV